MSTSQVRPSPRFLHAAATLTLLHTLQVPCIICTGEGCKSDARNQDGRLALALMSFFFFVFADSLLCLHEGQSLSEYARQQRAGILSAKKEGMRVEEGRRKSTRFDCAVPATLVRAHTHCPTQVKHRPLCTPPPRPALSPRHGILTFSRPSCGRRWPSAGCRRVAPPCRHAAASCPPVGLVPRWPVLVRA